jgi:hypothetical protein
VDTRANLGKASPIPRRTGMKRRDRGHQSTILIKCLRRPDTR